MNEQIYWYLARSSGMVAWGLLTLATLWGVFLSSGILGDRRRPAWLLSLHRWLGGLSVVFVGIHLAGLMLDSYVEFSWVDLLIPGTSEWRPVAVAFGVVGLYLLVAVEGTSLLMKKLPKRLWKQIHMTSFALFWLVSIHGALAGADATARWYQVASVTMIGSVMLVALYRFLVGHRRSALKRPVAPVSVGR
jgi:predicted ferric reductase